MARTKRWMGNPPATAEGWKQKAWCTDKLGIGWLVFHRPQASGSGWIDFKIVADGKAPGKANYWLSSNPNLQKIAQNRDLALMKANRPELYKQIAQVVLRSVTDGENE